MTAPETPALIRLNFVKVFSLILEKILQIHPSYDRPCIAVSAEVN